MKRLLLLLLVTNIFAINIDSLKNKAESGDVYANVILGEKYLYGEDGIEQNYEEAVTVFKKYISHPIAKYHLAVSYSNGWGVEKNLAKGDLIFKEFREAALKNENENIRDIYAYLGDCYYRGLGGVKSLKNAFHYTNLSANKGDAFGQYFLAFFYENAVWVEFDLHKAEELYQKSANQGFALATVALGQGSEGDLCRQLMFIVKDMNNTISGSGEKITVNGIELNNKSNIVLQGSMSNVPREMVFKQFNCIDDTKYLSERYKIGESERVELDRINNIEDSKELAKCMKKSIYERVKVKALQKIKDKKLLLKISNDDKYFLGKSYRGYKSKLRNVKDVIVWKLKYIAYLDIKNVLDQNILKKIARSNNDYYTRTAAIRFITDQSFLYDVVASTDKSDNILKYQAIKNIADQDVLKKIYENRRIHEITRLHALSYITDQDFLYGIAVSCINSTINTNSTYDKKRVEKIYATALFNITDNSLLTDLNKKKKKVDPHNFTGLLLAKNYYEIFEIIKRSNSALLKGDENKEIVKAYYVSNAIFKRLREEQNLLSDVIRFKRGKAEQIVEAMQYLDHVDYLDEFASKLDTNHPEVYYNSKIMIDMIKSKSL